MAHSPQRQSKETTHSRYEIVFESTVRGQDALRGVVGELKSFAERSGEAVGRGYAKVASSILKQVERFEDWNAERRSRLRSNRGSARRRAPAMKTAHRKIASSGK